MGLFSDVKVGALKEKAILRWVSLLNSEVFGRRPNDSTVRRLATLLVEDGGVDFRLRIEPPGEAGLPFSMLIRRAPWRVRWRFKWIAAKLFLKELEARTNKGSLPPK